MKAHRLHALGLTLFLLAGGACGGRSANEKAADGREEAAKAAANRLSGIYRARIPFDAALDAAASAPGREVYLVRGADVLTLVQVSGGEMPEGAPFNGLDWCGSVEQYHENASRHESVWRKHGTNNFLVVQIASHPQGATVTIIDDKADATRTCQMSPAGP